MSLNYVFCAKDGGFYVIDGVEEDGDGWSCFGLLDGERVELGVELKADNVPLIGRRFVMASDARYRYEVESLSVMAADDVVVRCLLSPQIQTVPEMHDVAKCVYLEIHQLLHVEWLSVDGGDGGVHHDVLRCTGIVTASDQLIKSRHFVGSADYFKDSIESVSVKHIRMTVISDGPIKGTLLTPDRTMDGDEDNASDSDSDYEDEDEDEQNEQKEKEKESVSEKSHCCVVHIPPDTAPFENTYSIHIIQLDHYSCTVPPPLCLTFFWMQCGDPLEDRESARRSLEKCLRSFYRLDFDDDGGDGRPLALMETVYEQRMRTLDLSSFPENVHIVQDLSDTIGYENAVQSAEALFTKMFPSDVWMEKE